MEGVKRGQGLLDREVTGLIVIDVQEAFRPVIDGFDDLVVNIRTLADGFGLLGRPVIVTEQYPKGLGRTVPEVEENLPAFTDRVEKVRFSGWGVPTFDRAVRRARCSSWVVCGIEAHVCVNQTVADLLGAGFDVHVAEDAVSSRFPHNREIGLRKMYAAGARATSAETALFEMLEAAGSDEFKAISKLVR